MNLAEFKDSCLNEESEVVVQKHLIEGFSFFFENHIGNPKEEYYFKKDISKSLGVHIREIVIVGSAKLGFSIKPEKPGYFPFKVFDFERSKNILAEPSDLDIAIISNDLFENQLFNIYNHTQGYSDVYSKSDQKKRFSNYILKGWLRPDLIPLDYSITPQIRNTQAKYKTKFKRKVNIGIYKSWYYFEKYHQNNILNINLNLKFNS